MKKKREVRWTMWIEEKVDEWMCVGGVCERVLRVIKRTGRENRKRKGNEEEKGMSEYVEAR